MRESTHSAISDGTLNHMQSDRERSLTLRCRLARLWLWLPLHRGGNGGLHHWREAVRAQLRYRVTHQVRLLRLRPLQRANVMVSHALELEVDLLDVSHVQHARDDADDHR